MTKKYKTIIEYVVQGDYGYGWEDLYVAETYEEGKSILEDYHFYRKDYPHRLMRRVVVEE